MPTTPTMRALAVARTIASERRPCFITNYIEAEAHALLLMESRRVSRAFTFDHHFGQFGRFQILGCPQV